MAKQHFGQIKVFFLVNLRIDKVCQQWLSDASLGMCGFFSYLNRDAFSVVHDTNEWFPSALVVSRVNNDVDFGTSFWIPEAIVRGVDKDFVKDFNESRDEAVLFAYDVKFVVVVGNCWRMVGRVWIIAIAALWRRCWFHNPALVWWETFDRSHVHAWPEQHVFQRCLAAVLLLNVPIREVFFPSHRVGGLHPHHCGTVPMSRPLQRVVCEL